MLGNPVLAEDVTLDDSGLGGFCDIAHSGWKNSIAVVDLAILSQEADEVLFTKSVYFDTRSSSDHVIDLVDVMYFIFFFFFVYLKMIGINFHTHSKGRHREIWNMGKLGKLGKFEGDREMGEGDI